MSLHDVHRSIRFHVEHDMALHRHLYQFQHLQLHPDTVSRVKNLMRVYWENTANSASDEDVHKQYCLDELTMMALKVALDRYPVNSKKTGQMYVDYVRPPVSLPSRLAFDQPTTSYGFGLTENELIQRVFQEHFGPELEPEKKNFKLRKLKNLTDRIVMYQGADVARIEFPVPHTVRYIPRNHYQYERSKKNGY